MSVQKRILGAFALLAGIVLVVSVLAINGLVNSDNRLTDYIGGIAFRNQLATDIRGAAERRAIAARNLVLVTEPADRRAEEAAVTAAHQETGAALKELRKAVESGARTTSRDRELLAGIEDVEARYGPVALDIVRMAVAGEHEAAIRKMNIECRPLLAALLAATEAYVSYGETEAKQYSVDAEAAYRVDRMMLIIACLVAVLSAATMGVLISNAIIRPLRESVHLAEKIAAGDLNTVVVVRSSDETGQLQGALQHMQARLAEIVGKVREGAEAVGTTSRQLAQGNDDLSQRTQEQAAALEETAASMEEMTATVKQNADNARAANQLAVGARSHAEQGGVIVGKAVSAMNDINTASKRISDIIGVIDEIAFQTNLLALNAAVEAARAGEQGRGFAVVASEVRSLAQRSATAAKEIKELISDSVEKVRVGSAHVDESGKTLKEIMDSVRKVTDIVAEIAAASNEQASGIDQVNNAVTQMDTTTQQNAAVVEEAAAASKSMETQAEALVRQVAFFRIENTATANAAMAPAPVNAARTVLAFKKSPPAAAPRPAPRLAKASGDDSQWQEF